MTAAPQEGDLASRVDMLIRLVAIGITEGRSQTEQIRILDAAGFTPKSIAELLGTTSNTVRVALHGIRKKARR